MMTKLEAVTSIAQTIARFRSPAQVVTPCAIADAMIDTRRLVYMDDAEALAATNELFRRYGFDPLPEEMTEARAIELAKADRYYRARKMRGQWVVWDDKSDHVVAF